MWRAGSGSPRWAPEGGSDEIARDTVVRDRGSDSRAVHCWRGGQHGPGRYTSRGAVHAHPAHIHLGACSELDPNPAFPLTDVAPASNESGAETDSAAAIPVEHSVT